MNLFGICKQSIYKHKHCIDLKRNVIVIVFVGNDCGFSCVQIELKEIDGLPIANMRKNEILLDFVVDVYVTFTLV